MKRLIISFLFCICIVILLTIQVHAVEGEYNTGQETYTAKLYGVIEHMPENGREGLWIVNNREILVTEESSIEEKFGKTEIGAYVQIEGGYVDKIFKANRVEVKKGRD